ncbi:hypothetical protein A33M_4401 [Rhodovulum sp. PH10]|nr:hypothetical protein A33M_4401 [Rhodovulum sp. PH10]
MTNRSGGGEDTVRRVSEEEPVTGLTHLVSITCPFDSAVRPQDRNQRHGAVRELSSTFGTPPHGL